MSLTLKRQGVETGRTNRAEGRTILWAQVPPGQPNFNGPAIFIAEVAKDADDPDDYEDGDSFIPSNSFDGIVGKGWSGGSASNFGGTPGGTGVVGRGGRNQGAGVFGLGGGTPEPLMVLSDEERSCTLWFCVEGVNSGPAKWAQVLTGPVFDGVA